MTTSADTTTSSSTSPDIIFYTFAGGTDKHNFGASMSPFCAKLDQFLRFCGVAHRTESEVSLGFNKFMKLSPKGKAPFLDYKGTKIADSSLVIEFLKQQDPATFDLDATLTPEQRGIGIAL
jgi:glutathione S-transferase